MLPHLGQEPWTDHAEGRPLSCPHAASSGVGQISGVVPGAQPVPWQSGHCSTLRRYLLLAAKAASSKLMLTEARGSLASVRFSGMNRRQAEDVAQVAEYISKAAEAAESAEAGGAAIPPKCSGHSRRDQTGPCPRASRSPRTWAASLTP